MRKLLWNWTALLASVVALGSTGGGASVQSQAEQLLAPAERTQTPGEARSAAADKTPLPPAKHTPTSGAAHPGSRRAHPLGWSLAPVGHRSADSPVASQPRGAPRFPTGPPQA